METTLNGTEGSHSESFCEVQRLVICYHHLIYNLQTPSITNCIQTRHMPIHLSGMLGKLVPKSVSCSNKILVCFTIQYCGSYIMESRVRHQKDIMVCPGKGTQACSTWRISVVTLTILTDSPKLINCFTTNRTL